MNLRIFFDPVSIELQPSELIEPYIFANTISYYKTTFPDLNDIDIALIGLSEERGSITNTGAEKGANEIRKKLYTLRRGSGTNKIADLGNLRVGINADESYLRIKEVCSYLLERNIIPVLFGGTHDLDIGQFQAYENSKKLISFLNVDAHIDMNIPTEDISKNHLHRILLHEPNFLFNFSQIAYQSYFTDQETLTVLEKLYFEMYRIGQMRENLNEIEPVIRDADMVSFDITAIRHGDAPGNSNAQPFGLTGEEACQICWYAGLNSKLTSIGIYEYNPDFDERRQTASVVATMIWYFIEGFYNRKDDQDFAGKNYVRYIVSMQGDPNQLTFYKHIQTEKWWLEVPYPNNKDQYARNSIIPCSYSDYLTANRGELPYRWINTHAKLI
jgi:formiminoglutamase